MLCLKPFGLIPRFPNIRQTQYLLFFYDKLLFTPPNNAFFSAPL
ncbi:hypothetical protein THIOSC15_1480004 [uncultured Thiomicrorhabdus sp.]